MPAFLKAFFEQTLRPGFAFAPPGAGMPKKRLAGKSAHIVVTMGMPAFVYRWYFGAHGLKHFERSVLGFCGVRPVRASLVGLVEASDSRREKWLQRMEVLGRAGR